MKKQYSIFVIVLFITAFSILVNSCDSKSTSDDTDSKMNTRNLVQKISAKSYYYKSLASFAKGKTEIQLSDLSQIQGKTVNFVLLYETSAPWASNFDKGEYTITGNDILDGLLQSYDLKITQQFVIDDENEGVVIESKTILENPIEAARQLSLVDHVLMVHVKEIPAEDNSTDTADK